ncbi:MAG: hypothetical protein J5696_01650 [Lachnospiraceae bacterium]|nr:hypothetical protein [Lachnospiraceae bacterium]
MFEWKGFAKFWLWFCFIVNIIVGVLAVIALLGVGALAAVLGSSYSIYLIVMILSIIVEIACIVGLSMLLFKKKKVGFFILCGCQIANIILSFISGAIVGTAASTGIRAIGSAVISIVILYFAIKNYWDQLA